MKEVNTTIETVNQQKASNHNCEHIEINVEMPKFDSPECAAKFRRALRNIPSKSYIKNDGAKVTMYVRPFNLLEFGASVNKQGLEQCEATKKILRYLDKNKEEFLKFEHPAKS